MIKKLIFLFLIPINVFPMQEDGRAGVENALNGPVMTVVCSISDGGLDYRATSDNGNVLRVRSRLEGFSGSVIFGQGDNVRRVLVANPEVLYRGCITVHQEQKGRG